MNWIPDAASWRFCERVKKMDNAKWGMTGLALSVFGVGAFVSGFVQVQDLGWGVGTAAWDCAEASKRITWST